MNARSNGSTSSAAHIARILDTIEKRDSVVRAYCEVLADQALADADRLDRLPPEQHGPLGGLGIAIKEVFDVAGGLCAWGSDIHAGRRPKRDAAIVRALRDAGGIILGTTASTEYAMARLAPTTNPYDARRTPGASSSGSAAAVAAGMADIAIGSQTIGSGIRPASYCGVFGYKPTQGVFALEGSMPLSDILDHPVIFASQIPQIVETFDVLRESCAVLDASRFSTENTGQNSPFKKIALVTPWFEDIFSADVWEMVSAFARQIEVIHCEAISLPDTVGAREEGCLTTILSADMWRHHGGDYRRHSTKMSPKLKAWLERGRDIKANEYRAALEQRQELMASVWNALEDYDFAVTMATTDTAPLLTQGTGSRAPQRLWNLLGCPAVSGPIGSTGGLPVGIQIVARPGADATLLDFAAHMFRDAKRGVKAAHH